MERYSGIPRNERYGMFPPEVQSIIPTPDPRDVFDRDTATVGIGTRAKVRIGETVQVWPKAVGRYPVKRQYWNGGEFDQETKPSEALMARRGYVDAGMIGQTQGYLYYRALPDEPVFYVIKWKDGSVSALSPKDTEGMTHDHLSRMQRGQEPHPGEMHDARGRYGAERYSGIASASL